MARYVTAEGSSDEYPMWYSRVFITVIFPTLSNPQVVCRRILDYVSAGLMSPAMLDSRIEAVRRLQEEDNSRGGDETAISGNVYSCVTYVRHPMRLVHRFERLYLDSYLAHLLSLRARLDDTGEGEEKTIPDILIDAFTALDADLGR